MSAMEVLNNEITALRRVGFPCGVQMVTDPVPARYVTVPGGTKHEANAGVVPNPDRGTGPFHVHSWILGRTRVRGTTKRPTHFRFSFSSLYPRNRRNVHVLSVCHHALIDDDKEVSSLFYHPANLPPKRAGSAKEDLANEKSATDADVSPSTPDKVEFVESTYKAYSSQHTRLCRNRFAFQTTLGTSKKAWTRFGATPLP